MNTLTAAQTTSTESIAQNADLVEAPSIEHVEAPAAAETAGAKALRVAMRFTSPARQQRSLKKSMGSVGTAVIISTVLLSSITALTGFMQDQLDPRADQVSGSVELTGAQVENIRASTLMKHYECSTGGLPEGVVPAHALVRMAGAKDGRVSFVSFDEGWAIHMDGSRGELAAVCAK